MRRDRFLPLSPRPLLLCAVLPALGLPAAAGDVLAPTSLVSATPAGQLQSGFVQDARVSADGRFVVFWSDASDLVPGDTNGTYDVFLRDRLTGTTEIVSVAVGGGPSNGPSVMPSVSGDGRYVCFDSSATNLVAPGTSGLFSIYLRDRLLGTTELVSRASGPTGVQANNTTELSAISADGRWVAFGSYADNLSPTKPVANGIRDLYLRDRLTHTTTLISHSPSGAPCNGFTYRPSISADGGRIAFRAQGDNLGNNAVTWGRPHVYVYHRLLDVVTLESKTAAGVEGNVDSQDPEIAEGGGHLVFTTAATNLIPPGGLDQGVAYRDLASGTFVDVQRTSLGQPLNGLALWPSVSGDGRYVAYTAAGPVPNASGGVFVRDVLLGKTFAACSTDAGNGQSAGFGAFPRLSGDGSTVVFNSFGPLVAGVAQLGDGVYARGLGAPLTYCVGKPNSQGCTPEIGFTGEARVSNGFALTVRGTKALNNAVGLLVHGLTGPTQIPFGGSLLCVAPPFARSQVVTSGGTPPPANDCSGVWSLGLGSVLASSPIGPQVTAGSVLILQWWGRDPFFTPPTNVQLSDALQVFVAP